LVNIQLSFDAVILNWRARAMALNEHGSRNGSDYRYQPAIGMWLCAEQTLANGIFNERERFLGLSRFGTKLYGRQLIFLSFNTRLGLFQRAACMLQLTFGGDDEFTLCGPTVKSRRSRCRLLA
jgi:hypothetical protein